MVDIFLNFIFIFGDRQSHHTLKLGIIQPLYSPSLAKLHCYSHYYSALLRLSLTQKWGVTSRREEKECVEVAQTA